MDSDKKRADASDDIADSGEKITSANRFVGPSLLLFLDQSLIAVVNWLYWLIISRLTTTSDIGQATTVTSLVFLIGTLTQLGFEYPLLKRSSSERSRVLGTVLVIELTLSVASVPIIIYVFANLFHHSLQVFTGVGIGILIITQVAVVSRFVLLGISATKSILIIDAVSIALKFATGYAFLTMGLKASAILLSFLLQYLLMTVVSLFVAKRKKFEFRLGDANYFKEVTKEGLANLPSKLSRLLILNASVVLLASIGISSSEIGIFYVALLVTIVAGASASSMAYMVIPASSALKRDLSSDSIRIGLSLTAPLIVALIVAPKFILSIIGQGYIPGYGILTLLSIAILPYSIVSNAISKLNNLGKSGSRKLVLIGLIEISTFFAVFFFVVPHYRAFGAAVATLVAFTVSSIPAVIWSEKASLRYIATSGAAILGGIAGGYSVYLIFGNHSIAAVLVSIALVIIIIIGLKNTSIVEIRQLVRGMTKRR